MPEKLASDKHSSLLGWFVGYKENVVLWIWYWKQKKYPKKCKSTKFRIKIIRVMKLLIVNWIATLGINDTQHKETLYKNGKGSAVNRVLDGSTYPG